MTRWIELETYRGDPIQSGTTTITPYTRILRLIIPKMGFGMVWNRPSAVMIEGPGQSKQEILIPDPTRFIQLALIGAMLSFLLVFISVNRYRR